MSKKKLTAKQHQKQRVLAMADDIFGAATKSEKQFLGRVFDAIAMHKTKFDMSEDDFKDTVNILENMARNISNNIEERL